MQGCARCATLFSVGCLWRSNIAIFNPSTTLVTLTGKLLLGQDSLKLEALVPQLIASGHKNLVFDIGGRHTHRLHRYRQVHRYL